MFRSEITADYSQCWAPLTKALVTLTLKRYGNMVLREANSKGLYELGV